MDIDKQTQEKLQELQLREQNLQNFLLQKQAFQIELNEVDSAIEETEKSKDDMYKIVGQVMIKAEKQETLKDLKEKKKILDMRIKAIENQEKILQSKLDSLKKELESSIKSKEK